MSLIAHLHLHLHLHTSSSSSIQRTKSKVNRSSSPFLLIPLVNKSLLRIRTSTDHPHHQCFSLYNNFTHQCQRLVATKYDCRTIHVTNIYHLESRARPKIELNHGQSDHRSVYFPAQETPLVRSSRIFLLRFADILQSAYLFSLKRILLLSDSQPR